MRLRAETHAAIEAARAGGRILERWFGRVGTVRLKGPRDPVTRADGVSERAICRLLHRRFPAIGCLGEDKTDVGAITVTDPVMAEGLLPPESAVWLTFQTRGLSLLPEGASAVEAAS